MAAAALWESAREAEEFPADLDAWIAKELAEIVREAERVSKTEKPGAASWFYQVPFPGVRYYSDRAWPHAVKPGRRRGAPRKAG
tara:strand:+ start:720 stop:971 length:252 start_codon:yes stop_codon:yes gene_type:complete